MKKKLLSLLTVLLLVGCGSTPNSGNASSGPSESDGTPGEGQDGDPTGDVIEVDDNNHVISFSLSYSELIVNRNENNLYLTSGFKWNTRDGLDPTEEEMELNWSSTDESVVKVGQYGQVYAQNKIGTAIVYAETKIGGRRAKCVVRVVEDKDNLLKRYEKVDMSLDEPLKNGDIICFAYPEGNKTFTKNEVGRSLQSVTTTFSSDKSYIESLGADTAEFVIGYDETKEGWTLENQDNMYLNAANLHKVSWVYKQGNIYWDIFTDIDSGELCIESTSAVLGRLMYNASLDKFTLYDSSVQVDMFLPTIYKLTIVTE